LAENAEGARGYWQKTPRGRGGDGARGRKRKKMRSSRLRKSKPQYVACGVVWDPQSFKKPHNAFLSEFYFLSGSRFTSHDSLILIYEIATSSNQKTVSFLAMTEQLKTKSP
jgi:hypothetical protein